MLVDNPGKLHVVEKSSFHGFESVPETHGHQSNVTADNETRQPERNRAGERHWDNERSYKQFVGGRVQHCTQDLQHS